MNRRERRAAEASKKVSKSSGAPTAAALHELAVQHMQAGRPLDAQLCCQQALALDADRAETLHLMGLLSLQARQYDHAIAWIDRAARQDPGTDYLGSLGIALDQQGLIGESLKAFDRALQLRPDDIELWIHHGRALAKLERYAESLKSYRHVLPISPAHADAIYGCGVVLLKLGQPDEALRYLNDCAQMRPSQPAVLEQRGLVLFEMKKYEEALSDFRQAYALNSTNHETCNNIGSTLHLLSRDEEALQWYDRAIALRPDCMSALVNKGFILTELRRLDEAFATFDRARSIGPDDADLAFHLSLLQLLTGDFEAGWAGREARWRMRARPGSYPQFSQPLWRGDADLKGKTILVLEDEGLGDAIQFARYIPDLVARGARVVLRVGDPLRLLLSEMPGVAECSAKSDPSLPSFDLHCPICSLPFALGTRLDTVPAAIPYLPAPPRSRVDVWEARLAERLGPRRRLRVGLAWSGRITHPNDHNRSLPLQLLSRVLDVDADFVSLQKDPRRSDKAALEASGIVDLTDHLTDFAETAALVSCLDLLISVDTSIVHLAGALAQPVWTLLPLASDFRWLLDRDDSPWYPTMRLFRQAAGGDWAELIDRVHAELAEHVRRNGVAV